MHLIVGLGNPGAKYALTRHNAGFMAVDAIQQIASGSGYREECKSLTSKIKVNEEQALLVKPQTFMNNSGEAVQRLMLYYKISAEKLLVIHDEVDLPFNAIRYQTSRGHGGHNGIRSIHQHLDSKDYNRLKLGVGRPSNERMDVADYLLSDYSKSELKALPEILSEVAESVLYYLTNGFQKAATQFNRSPGEES